jgi:hypothetical protein
MVPILHEELPQQNNPSVALPKTRTAGWQRKKDAFTVPTDEDFVPGPSQNSYTRDDELPGPSTLESSSHQVTRPQPTEQARQIILEWSRP